MKDKVSSEINRDENDVKSHSHSVSSFHADAPTFQPRNNFVVGVNSGSNSILSSEIGSGLTASAQPFIPSSIRHNNGNIMEGLDHNFTISSNNYNSSQINVQSSGNSKQGIIYSNSTNSQDSTLNGNFGSIDMINGSGNVNDCNTGVISLPGIEYEGIVLGSGSGGISKTGNNILDDGTVGIPGIQYSNAINSNSNNGSNNISYQNHNINGVETNNFYGDSSNHSVTQVQQNSGINNHPNVLDLSEYCRRVRGWNLPFLRTVPQMNAITQIRHELQLQNISLLLTQNDIISMNPNSSSSQVNQHFVPPIVHRNFYGLCLLDDSSIVSTTRFCGYQTYAYKAINAEDYSAYCLRRIDNYPLSDLENSRPLLDRWQKLAQHPCIVSYRQCFASLDFPQGALIVVYDYIPNASTMESVHFKEPIGEPLLWNYIIQIVLALVHIHSSQLAARVIDPTKLLISYRGRLRLNCVGILDFTRIDESKTILDYQKQDLVALGYIILALCCGSLTIINDLNHAVEQIFLKSSMYSNDLKKLVLILLSKPALNKNNLDVFILANMLAARMIPQIEHSLKLTDALENEFRKEIDNGRLFRILTKINTIADRTQLNAIHKWNETGDRYICKLFREYLFQQTDSQGRPVIDMGHILDSLAKVDVGTNETVTLMSSDGSSILLVSFADIKHSIEKSFCEIIASTTTNSNFHEL